MALSRPFILAVLGAVLAVATFASMRAAGQRAEADQTAAAPKVVAAPRPTQAKTPKKHPGATTQTKAGPTVKAPMKTEPKKAAPAKKKASAIHGVPPKVASALQAKKTVVLFFRQPGADDDATESAVHSIKNGKHVAVFTDRISHLGRYQRVVANLGISQAPAIVVVGKDRQATLLEGFVDEGSLKQRVKDAK
jgi:outer membrane biosynthesis protein TonB